MHFLLNSVIISIFVQISVNAQVCSNGNKLIKLGTSKEGVQIIADIHNRYRLLIAQGHVPGQPQGTNLLRMRYDETLEQKAIDVVLQCDLKHLEVHDRRWKWVGQNLYIECSSMRDGKQNWEEAVKAWFDEHHFYSYGDGVSAATGHYTQVVWADTNTVGCAFSMYHDYGNPATPYCKLYACNYGPGGNVVGELPYEVDDSSECINLCSE